MHKSNNSTSDRMVIYFYPMKPVYWIRRRWKGGSTFTFVWRDGNFLTMTFSLAASVRFLCGRETASDGVWIQLKWKGLTKWSTWQSILAIFGSWLYCSMRTLSLDKAFFALLFSFSFSFFFSYIMTGSTSFIFGKEISNQLSLYPLGWHSSCMLS